MSQSENSLADPTRLITGYGREALANSPLKMIPIEVAKFILIYSYIRDTLTCNGDDLEYQQETTNTQSDYHIITGEQIVSFVDSMQWPGIAQLRWTFKIKAYPKGFSDSNTFAFMICNQRPNVNRLYRLNGPLYKLLVTDAANMFVPQEHDKHYNLEYARRNRRISERVEYQQGAGKTLCFIVYVQEKRLGFAVDGAVPIKTDVITDNYLQSGPEHKYKFQLYIPSGYKFEYKGFTLNEL